MSDSSPSSSRESGASPQPYRTPRWVKTVAILALAVILLFVVLHLSGNSLGGPGTHLPG